MKTVRFLLPALLVAFAANLALAQSQDKPDKARGAIDKNRKADAPAAQASPQTATESAQRRRRVEEQTRAERFPPQPSPSIPPKK